MIDETRQRVLDAVSRREFTEEAPGVQVTQHGVRVYAGENEAFFDADDLAAGIAGMRRERDELDAAIARDEALLAKLEEAQGRDRLQSK